MARPLRMDDLPSLFPSDKLRHLELRQVSGVLVPNSGPHNLMRINHLAGLIRRELMAVANEAADDGNGVDISIMISISRRGREKEQ